MTEFISKAAKFDPKISAVKGLAMVLIVLCHAGLYIPLADFTILFNFPCFIFISGFLLKDRHLSSPKAYLLGKVKRLYLPYVSWMFAFMLLHNLFASIYIYPDFYSWSDIPEKLFRIVTMQERDWLLGTFWCLKEFFYAAIISFVAIWTTKSVLKKHYRPYYIFLYSIIALLCACLFSKSPIVIPTVGRQTFLTMAYFFLGYAFANINYRVLLKKWLALLLFAILAVISIDYTDNFNAVNWHILDYFEVSLFGILGTFILCHTLSENGILLKFFSKIGDYTMSILLLQFMAFKVVDYVKVLVYDLPVEKLSDFPIISEHNSYFFVIYTIAGLLMPIFATVLYKRIKNKIMTKIKN